MTPALSCRGLGLDIGGARILGSVDLAVAPGELLAVIGPNGAGKTSLLNLVTGLHRASRGSVSVAGRDVTKLPVHRRARAGLARTFQTSSVFPALSVEENVRLGTFPTLPGRRRSRWLAASRDRVTAALAAVGMSGTAERRAGDLSHGDKRKLDLAIVLASDPTVICLDEPLAGVAAGDVPQLVEVIRGLTASRGAGGARRAVLLVEHHMDTVLDLAQRVAVLHHGELLACAHPAEVMADPAVRTAYLGEPL